MLKPELNSHEQEEPASAPVERLNERLEGEFSYENRNYTAAFALVGDTVWFRVKGKGRRRKIFVDRIEPGPAHRITPFCEHFGECGGCRGQHLSVEDQFKLKATAYIESMARLGVEVEQILPDQNQRYRNRMDFVVESSIVGLRPAGNFRRFVDVRSCKIQRQHADEVLAMLRLILAEHPALPFTRRGQSGNLKYITIREGAVSGAVIFTLCEGRADSDDYQSFESKVVQSLIDYKAQTGFQFSLFVGEVGPLSETSAPPDSKPVYGDPFFEEYLGPLLFRVPADSFFQPNPSGFYQLFAKALAATESRFQGGDVIDLYCGSAALSLLAVHLLPGINAIYGADFSMSGVELGRRNIDMYNHKHSKSLHHSLHAFDLMKGLPDFGETSSTAKLMIVDPPRAGLSPRIIDAIKHQLKAPLLLSVSCSPMTQVQNLIELESDFRPVYAAVTDPFPNTTHLESVVLLERR